MAGASSQVMVTHVTLELRLYVMYARSRKILAFFVRTPRTSDSADFPRQCRTSGFSC
ncbi:hypothetical protein L208DRAFT_1417083 [Tricholoma matsutake]|nr:hypothetical protein L208DRAFT_1417083 [Tricholoma matsutake 945]